MVGWHHRLNGHEFEQTPGDSEDQESLACCSPWGHRVRHDSATEHQQQAAQTSLGLLEWKSHEDPPQQALTQGPDPGHLLWAVASRAEKGFSQLLRNKGNGTVED